VRPILRKTALVAIGGNSLIRAGEPASLEGELQQASATARAVAALVADGWRLLVTHGNGPQVGAALVRSERAAEEVYPLTLNVCGAVTQGEIGYVLQQALGRELAARQVGRPVATVLTQVVVSETDAAFADPTKPIGPFYTASEAERRRQLGWTLVEDAAHGFRRVVASPEPIEVVEAEVIRALVDRGVLVVALGGGGIPVVRRGDALVGVDAVIDKDRASALLASRLRVELLVISTGVDRVCLDYRKPGERPLDEVTMEELERHYRAGQFPPGSMGPKIEAALRFLRDGGGEVIITSPERLAEAVAGRAGTHVLGSARTRTAAVPAELGGTRG
jgi:carbamate kinase